MKLEIKSEKVVGYVLLSMGVGMIFLSVYLMFNVFTGVSSPPILVNFYDISIPLPVENGNVPIVSGQELSKMAGMVFWYMLMFFVMWSGGKIASIGVKLIKETIVKTETNQGQ